MQTTRQIIQNPAVAVVGTAEGLTRKTPVALDALQLKQVAGGLPCGTWAVPGNVEQLPCGTW